MRGVQHSQAASVERFDQIKDFSPRLWVNAHGVFVFGLAGSWRIWPLPCVVAVTGEIIPNALFNTWDRGDWWDLLANFSGLALALGLVMLVQRFRARRRKRQEDTQGEPPVSVA